MKMISCKNRMPDNTEAKLVYGMRHYKYFADETFYQIAYYYGYNWFLVDNLGAENADIVENVTHWCDLPLEME